MIAKDFILQTRSDLQEKSEHWSDEELLIKLKRAYIALQKDLPYFMDDISLNIEKGKKQYYLTFTPLSAVRLLIENINYKFTEHERLYLGSQNNYYTFYAKKLLLQKEPTHDSIANITYKYLRELETGMCHLEIPVEWEKALRFGLLREVHEKPTLNAKVRSLSNHYEKEYLKELYKLKVENKIRPKNITSKYQRI